MRRLESQRVQWLIAASLTRCCLPRLCGGVLAEHRASRRSFLLLFLLPRRVLFLVWLVRSMQSAGMPSFSPRSVMQRRKVQSGNFR